MDDNPSSNTLSGSLHLNYIFDFGDPPNLLNDGNQLQHMGIGAANVHAGEIPMVPQFAGDIGANIHSPNVPNEQNVNAQAEPIPRVPQFAVGTGARNAEAVGLGFGALNAQVNEIMQSFQSTPISPQVSNAFQHIVIGIQHILNGVQQFQAAQGVNDVNVESGGQNNVVEGTGGQSYTVQGGGGQGSHEAPVEDANQYVVAQPSERSLVDGPRSSERLRVKKLGGDANGPRRSKRLRERD